MGGYEDGRTMINLRMMTSHRVDKRRWQKKMSTEKKTSHVLSFELAGFYCCSETSETSCVVLVITFCRICLSSDF